MSGLTEREIKMLADIFEQISAIEVGVLFGSRAMGTHRPASDVDIVLYGSELTYADILRAKVKIEETTLPYLFDLIVAGMIRNENLLTHIRKHGKTIYQRTDKAWDPDFTKMTPAEQSMLS